MIPCSSIDTSSKQLCFSNFPAKRLNYLNPSERDSDSDLVSFQVIHTETQEIFSVLIRGSQLQNIGISLTVWRNVQDDSDRLKQLVTYAAKITKALENAAMIASAHLPPDRENPFIQKRASISRAIIRMVQNLTKHSPIIEGVPGIYLHQIRNSGPEIFINLKNSLLGEGSYGKIKRALRLFASSEENMLVVRKIFKRSETCRPSFSREGLSLREFRNQRGIISLIVGGIYEGRSALFFPIYECDLFHYLKNPPFPLSMGQKLNMMSQWLEGLSTLSQKGVHGDLSPANLLLKRLEDNKIEAVISDFGAFQFYGNEMIYGLTTTFVRSPEYLISQSISSKQDVWALGISLHGLLAPNPLLYWRNLSNEMITYWAKILRSNWSRAYPMDPETPPWACDLIHEMLEPDPIKRPSATEVFRRFSDHFCLYQERSDTPSEETPEDRAV